MSNNKELSIEEQFERLEEIHQIILNPETTIEDAANIFNQAMNISNSIQEKLSQFQSQIEILVGEHENKLEFEPYGESDSKTITEEI